LIPRTPTLPCTELAMWRKFLACVHADDGVELEIFRRAGSLRGVICGAKTRTHNLLAKASYIGYFTTQRAGPTRPYTKRL
jgi:hypothetical protein